LRVSAPNSAIPRIFLAAITIFLENGKLIAKVMSLGSRVFREPSY
jgi:hypothetical protein